MFVVENRLTGERLTFGYPSKDCFDYGFGLQDDCDRVVVEVPDNDAFKVYPF